MRVILFAMLCAAAATADTVHLKNGRKITGKVTREEPDVAVTLQGGGSITVARADVEKIWLSDESAALDEVARRRKPGTAAALVDAAEWALFHGMKDVAEKAWKDAIAVDPACRAAHEALGHVEHEGRWMTPDEKMVATGHVKHGDRWVTVEEKSKLDAGWEFIEGKLVPADEAKKARGLVEHEGKWITKKEWEAIEAEARAAKEKMHDPKEDAEIMKKWGTGWRFRKGERYRLITNAKDADPEFDEKLVKMMDGFWDFYCDTFAVKPVQKKLHNIVCFDTREEFDAWSAKNGGMVGAYGFYQHGDPWRPAVLWRMEGLRGSQFTARHECGHQFVAHYVRQDGEAWFGEGIATIFECEGDVPFQDHLYRWEVVRKAVIEEGTFTIAGMMLNSGKQSKDANYCLGAAVHNFFLTSHGKKYRKAYQEYLKTGTFKDPEALAKVIGKSMTALEVEFSEWVRELNAQRKIFPKTR